MCLQQIFVINLNVLNLYLPPLYVIFWIGLFLFLSLKSPKLHTILDRFNNQIRDLSLQQWEQKVSSMSFFYGILLFSKNDILPLRLHWFLPLFIFFSSINFQIIKNPDIKFAMEKPKMEKRHFLKSFLSEVNNPIRYKTSHLIIFCSWTGTSLNASFICKAQKTLQTTGNWPMYIELYILL